MSKQIHHDFLLTNGHAHNVIASPCAALFLSPSICNSTMFLSEVCSYGNTSLFHHLQKAIPLFRLSATPINRNTEYGTCIVSRSCKFRDTYFLNRCVEDEYNVFLNVHYTTVILRRLTFRFLY